MDNTVSNCCTLKGLQILRYMKEIGSYNQVKNKNKLGHMIKRNILGFVNRQNMGYHIAVKLKQQYDKKF